MKFSRKKRFLLLMPEYVWGGAETQFRYLISYAEERGYPLDVLIEHRFKQEDSDLKKDVDRAKYVRFFELDEYEADRKKFVWDMIKHVLVNIFKTKYKACLVQYTPDLFVAPVFKLLGINVIYSERNDASVLENNAVYRKCLRYCRTITTNSRYAQKALKKLTGRNAIFIRNGKPVLEALAAKESREIRNILVPCRVFPLKNQMMVLHYIRDSEWFKGKVIFAGRIEDKDYFRKLLHFINANRLQDRVEFPGQADDMRKLYQMADIVILPSFLEGTPNVVLESYLYGRPVIVSDTNTVRDLVPDPKLRFPLQGTKGIGSCINYIRSLSDEAYKLMLKRNRDYVIANYQVEKMAARYFHLLNA